MKIQGKSDALVALYKQNMNNLNKSKEHIKVTDRIEISKTGKEIKKYIEEYKNIDINSKDINKIKTEINSGKYKVDEKKLAESILNNIKRGI